MIHKISEDAPEHFKANGGITAGSGAPSNSNDDFTSKHIDIDSRSSQTTAIVEKKQYPEFSDGTLLCALYDILNGDARNRTGDQPNRVLCIL